MYAQVVYIVTRALPNLRVFQELAQLIEEANQSLEESGTPSHEILVVVLHREIVGHGSIGITLAGGADYEAKEITVSALALILLLVVIRRLLNS